MKTMLAGLLLCAALGAAASPPAKAKIMTHPEKTVVDASFEVRAPAGWSVERRTDGAVLTGPSSQGLPARVVVRYVRPDHPLHKSADAYMARLTKASTIPMKGWKDEPLEKLTLAGRPALRLRRETSEFSAPESISPKEVPMREEHVAMPAKEGFYLLIYTAPLALDKAQRPLFRRLVETGFKPKL